jgi:hypothetical protein
LFRDGVLLVPDTGVWDLFHTGFGNLTAHRVGLLAVTNFLFHPGASHASHFCTSHPASAGDGPAGLLAGHMATALLVFTTARARIPFPRSTATNALVHNRSRNLFRFRDPIACAERNFFGFTNRLADGVADIAVAGLHFRSVRRAADFTIFRFANRFADGAADIAVAGLEAWLPDRAADVLIASLDAGFTDRAANVLVAGLKAGFADGAADISVTSLVNRLADGVTLIAIARFVNIARAGYRNLFRAGLVDGSATVHGVLFVDGFTNRLIAHATTAFG